MSSIARARVPGPLAPFADGFRAELDRLGYTPASREYKVNEMSRLSRWLGGRGLGVGDVGAGRVEEFLADFGAGRRRAPTLRAMRPLMTWLRAEGLIGSDPAPASQAADDLMDAYRRWMLAERGLAARTIGRYETTARRFLEGRAEAAGGGTGAESLDAASVISFLLAEVARGLAPGSLQGRVAELRSLLRFFYLSGVTGSPLAAAVPPVPGWKDTAVPRLVTAAQVRALLGSCDRSTATGKRDFAMLMLLARLGLRAAEVAGLRLADFDWRAGELAVTGKARRADRLPLPADVGEAVACYLAQARPRAGSGTVFLTAAAPPRPMGSTAVSQMVWRQCAQAGLTPVRAHRLPSALEWDDLGEDTITAFLDHLEADRGNSARTRNLRLTAIRSLFRYAALRHPEHAALIGRVLAIPAKRFDKAAISFLTAQEAGALIEAADRQRWEGRRDRALIVLALQTGLRVSELTGLDCGDITLGTGAHVSCTGKGRKQRAVPLTRPTQAVLRVWMAERAGSPGDPLFPTRTGRRLSRDAIERRIAVHAAVAAQACPSLAGKKLHPHVLRHTCAMALLRERVDTAVIALWLGHADIRSTDAYIHADLSIKERALAATTPASVPPGRYRPPDAVLAFLESL